MSKKYSDPVPIPPFQLVSPLRFKAPGYQPIIKVDFYVDFGCPWCCLFWVDQWKKLRENYILDKENKGTEDKCGYGDVQFTFHMTALSYIPVSWDLLKTMNYCYMKKPEELVNVIDFYCENEKKVRHSELIDVSRRQLADLLFELFLSKFGFDKEDYVKEMLGFKNEVFNRGAAMVKYVLSKGISTTPSMMVNDVLVDGRWDFDDWVKLLDKVKKSYGPNYKLWE